MELKKIILAIFSVGFICSANAEIIKPAENLSAYDVIKIQLNALKNKQIPTKSILGDTETALVFFGVIANSNIDIELLVYKYFGDIPALMLRKMFIKSQEKESTNNNHINQLLKSFRDISIRLDRIEQALLNG